MQLVIFVEVAILIQMTWNLYSRLLGACVGCCNFSRNYWAQEVGVPIYHLAMLYKLINAFW
jgi:hypothetical protein